MDAGTMTDITTDIILASLLNLAVIIAAAVITKGNMK